VTRLGGAALALLLIAASVSAEEPRPSQAACERPKLPGRAYLECLEAAARSDRCAQ